MRQSRVSCPTVGGSDRCDMADRIVGLLRKRYPIKTAESVATDLGISVCTVEKWIERHSVPSLAMYRALVGTYGPEMIAAMMGDWALPWLVQKNHDKKRDDIIAAMKAQLESL